MRYRKNIFKDKSFLAMAIVSLLAIAAIAGGMLMTNDSKEPETSYIADLNDNAPTSSGVSDEIVANNGATKASDETISDDNTNEETTDNISVALNENESNSTDESETTAVDDNLSEAGVGVSNFSFSADSTLVWPVETNDVIIDYSPDSTVYFATLDKYKTSDAIAIRSEVGTPVYAAAAGTVSAIDYDEEIGNSVSLDLGSDYTLQYGQIKDIQVSEGDVVSEGDLLCYVANPTKYYSVEGPNLYLKLNVGENTADPLDYLDFE